MKRVIAAIALAAAALPFGAAQAQDAIELHGASQFGDEHAFTKALVKFEELVGDCYDGDVTFVLHKNSELGLEKDYFNFMSQGVSVDYAIVSPSHMSTYSKMAPLMDMPFLFRDIDHWNKVLEQDGLAPIAEDVSKRADVELIGYAGGGTRNLIVNRPVRTMEDLKGLPMRVMGAPIQTRIFDAVNAAPSVIAYDEVYNAIQTGVIDAAENEAAGIEQMKFYEVGPHISKTQHAITVRPIGFSGKTMRRLPEALQACVREAGAEAGKYGREIESTQDSEKLKAMEEKGLLTTYDFEEREKLLELAEPVKRAYAEELGATETLERINAIQ
ncbi:C4-dicarboxylate ABC transporter substrate-binding protein [Acuticoccus sediminis]|uniref:C4-dicarboxylate ABC transporter substrate-binding protein n=1 Tax=Acuticoccus sediminis TaxID=2184697 RepID=A0A8B2NL37_9HYPH|nr:TRAP transporter substrate-binding protein [Acuticoccus sediminis]RAH98313.1 C4-dicarboxylate ABC transporter substrate-binding protein [Acuticoccus sediminis]